MSKVTDTTIGGGIITLDRRANRRFSSTAFSAVSQKRHIYSRAVRRDLPSYSYLTQCADAWALLSSGDQIIWNNSGSICGMTGFNLFVQDKTYRLINGIPGNATPAFEYQYLVGHLFVPTSAGHFLFRMVGTGTFDDAAILRISYADSFFVDSTPGDYLVFRFKYTWLNSGVPTVQTTEYYPDYGADWFADSQAITYHANQTGFWELEIEGDKIHGDLWFDNFWVECNGRIITFDPYCNEVQKKFFALNSPAGVTFESWYPDY